MMQFVRQTLRRSISTRVVIQDAGKRGRGLYANQEIKSGEVICASDGEILSRPTKFTVQYNEKTHVDVQPPLVFANHHCEPNARIDFDESKKVLLKALRTIKPEEEIFFDYNTTEESMATPFPCECGSPNCHKHVQGFVHLPADKQSKMTPYLSPYILGVYERSKTSRHAPVVPSQKTEAVA